jgi:MFS family permease
MREFGGAQDRRRPNVFYIEPLEHRKVVFSASLGTIFEWYDFYLYATLAPFFASLFFPPGNETAALLSALGTYAAGFLIRPFGAVVFGRIGDLKGRKHAFLISMVLMGTSTFAIGLLPTFEQIGWLAPGILLLLRLAQGFALGGEYGGAATYVAEYTPAQIRGLSTGWIQTTATVGFFLSLLVILLCRSYIPADDFKEWGWRIPFLVSIFLLIFSAYIRLRLKESPLFLDMRASGKLSHAPLRESFLQQPNSRIVLFALLGAVAGQGVVWYTGQFYALFYLQITLKLDYEIAYNVMMIVLLMSTPFFIFFGWLSDKIGRKPIILAGCLLAVLTYFPIFNALTRAVNPDLAAFTRSSTVVLYADKDSCNFHVLVGPWSRFTDCDRAKDYLSKLGVSFDLVDRPNAPGGVKVGNAAEIPIARIETRTNEILQTLTAYGYPLKANPAKLNLPLTIFLLAIMMIYVCMVYGPMAAFLVELFPTRIRYTSMSLPYHLGNGWFGGLLPLVATAIAASSGNIYYGLWYPIGVAAMTFIVGLIFLPDRYGRELLHDPDHAPPPPPPYQGRTPPTYPPPYAR